MSAALELRTAAELMRAQHGPDCPDHAFFAAVAARLEREDGPDELRIARAYLATQPAPEVTR